MAILGKRLRIGNRECAGLACHGSGKGCPAQKMFDVGQAPRNRRDASQHHTCCAYAIAVHMQHHRHTDFGMGPGCAVRDFQIGADHTSSGRRHAYAGEELRGHEGVFPRRVLTRQDEKIGCGKVAWPSRTRDLERRMQRD